jgi:hypothetical protein
MNEDFENYNKWEASQTEGLTTADAADMVLSALGFLTVILLLVVFI